MSLSLCSLMPIKPLCVSVCVGVLSVVFESICSTNRNLSIIWHVRIDKAFRKKKPAARCFWVFLFFTFIYCKTTWQGVPGYRQPFRQSARGQYRLPERKARKVMTITNTNILIGCEQKWYPWQVFYKIWGQVLTKYRFVLICVLVTSHLKWYL